MVPGRLKPWLLVPPLVALLLGALIGFAWRAPSGPAPDPEAIARAAMLSIREQGRLVAYSARFVAVVSAERSSLGLSARKTLIRPGTVRYGIDLSRLRSRDLAWERATRTLTVTLPPLEITGPDIDLQQVQEYSEGGLLLAFTDAERTLDQANRRSAQDELMRQARERIPSGRARIAAMQIVARAFAMPIRASGVDASVAIRLVGPDGREEATYLDRPARARAPEPRPSAP
jgi:hypothetical protein